MAERLPKNSCDTHLHVFGDAMIYPANNPNALYQPPQGYNLQALQHLHADMGIDRAVIVQATIYGTDHSFLYDTLKSSPAGKYRGVGIVDDSMSDIELQRLTDVGVCCARFNFGGEFKLVPDLTTFRRSLDRVRAFGWSAKIFGSGDDFLALEDELRKIDMPVMIDHMGRLDYRCGQSQPVVRLILDLLAKDNWWIGLSNGDRRSNYGEPWDDAVEFGRLFYDAAPDRCLWGTDWPHVHRFIRPHEPHDRDYDVNYEMKRVGLLERYVPDRAARDHVLVDNPAQFFKF